MDESMEPECPKCGAKITTLDAYAREESYYVVYLDSAKFDPELDSLGYDYQQCVEGTTTHTDFECPQCKEVLFTAKGDTQPQEVIDFLRE